MEKIIENKIKAIINTNLSPSVLNIINESSMHNVPANSESHFKIIIVSDIFKDVASVNRHKIVYKTLGSVMDDIHALSIYAFDINEFDTNPMVLDSPNCANQ